MEQQYPPRRIDPELAGRLSERGAELAQGDAFGSAEKLPGLIVGVLNFALTLEYLEAEFYTKATSTPGLIPPDVRDVFDEIRRHETEHVEYLQGILGNRAVAKPGFDFTGGKGQGNGPFGDVFQNPKTFLALSQAFEDTGVRAYKGQAANLMGDGDILEAALTIHSVEARHASLVRHIRGDKGWISQSSRGSLPRETQRTYKGEDNSFHILTAWLGGGAGGGDIGGTEAFDEPLTKWDVMKIVRPFLAKGG